MLYLSIKLFWLDEDVKALIQEIIESRSIQVAHAPRKVRMPLTPRESKPTYTWRIANFTRKLFNAKSDRETGALESEQFFSSHGYMGVFMSLLTSNRDGISPWPFTRRCKFVVVDQQNDVGKRQNIQKAFFPEGEKNFNRPRQRANIGRGFPDFVRHSILHTRQYIRDHAVYIKIILDR